MRCIWYIKVAGTEAVLLSETLGFPVLQHKIMPYIKREPETLGFPALQYERQKLRYINRNSESRGFPLLQ